VSRRGDRREARQRDLFAARAVTVQAVSEPGRPGINPAVANHARWMQRVFGGYDVDGPRVRVGFLWFLLLAGSLYLGLVALGVLYGLVAGVAATQVCREWRSVGRQPSRIVAGLGALAIPISAAWSLVLPGLIALAVPVLAVAAALARRRRRTPLLDAAGTTVRASVFHALGAAAVVVTFRASVAGAIILVVFVCAYEMGDYLVGTESASALIGPIAGMIAVGVFTFTVAVFQLSPFTEPLHAVVFGALVAVLCPLSQLGSSLLLPAATAHAPALRRVDSLLLTGPAWVWLLWNYLSV
jgi:hypothetical protein